MLKNGEYAIAAHFDSMETGLSIAERIIKDEFKIMGNVEFGDGK